MVWWLASLALAAELSLTSKVVAINRDDLSDSYFIKMQGMSLKLKSPPGEVYQCLRQGLSSEDIIVFTFDTKTLNISTCEARAEAFAAERTSVH